MLLCKPWHFLFSRCMTGKIRLLAVMIENPVLIHSQSVRMSKNNSKNVKIKMKRGLIIAPTRLTVLAVFNSGTLRWQCSTAAHCACSVQQRHTALAVFNSGLLCWQCSTAAHCTGNSAEQTRHTWHTALAVQHKARRIQHPALASGANTNKKYIAPCAGSSATQTKYI